MEIKNEILKQIWNDRYRKGNETIEDNIRRVAKYISKDSSQEQMFFDVMNNGQFFPAGRTMSNAGIGKNLTLNNCFTLNFVEDSIVNIFDKIKMGAITQKAGGGTGYEFSKIRPNGTPTSNDAIASGVVSFMDVFNAQTATIMQGSRRGANMGVLSIRHPDIYEYISAKSYEEGKLVHFNISVMVDDEFMVAVENDLDFNLHFPVYDEKGFIIKDKSKWTTSKTIKARELWDVIMKKAYDNGEPGILFYENMNRDNNTYYMENIVNTNPCGEFLGGLIYDNKELDSENYKGACNLGSLFLHNFVLDPFTEVASIDLVELQNAIRVAVTMLDNIIDINKFPHDDYYNYQSKLRTIGLGVSGIGDTLAMLNLKYGSPESLKFIDIIMNFITSEAYYCSTLLARDLGSFPGFKCDEFINSNFIQKHLKSHGSLWHGVVDNIRQYGMRNARLISIAPTGTLSLTYGNNCSSGLEPIFSLEYDRKVKIGGQSDDDIQIVKMRDYAYEKWLDVKDEPSCIVKKDVFTTAMELPVSAHIDVLSTIAYHVDMSCSKTINVPTDYPFDDCKDIYMKCWKNGVKGCTIFRPNEIRQGILISENSKKDEPIKLQPELPWGYIIKPSDDLVGRKRKLMTGCGSLHLQAWGDPENGNILEVFLSKGSSGGCFGYMNGLSRMISVALRSGCPLEEVANQLDSVMACPSYVGRTIKTHDTSKGSSCPNAIGRVLLEIQNELWEELGNSNDSDTSETKVEEPIKVKEPSSKFTKEETEFLNTFGSSSFAQRYKKCPTCGSELSNAGGCLQCRDCGYSKCD